jgi:hypothetical protein
MEWGTGIHRSPKVSVLPVVVVQQYYEEHQ